MIGYTHPRTGKSYIPNSNIKCRSTCFDQSYCSQKDENYIKFNTITNNDKTDENVPSVNDYQLNVECPDMIRHHFQHVLASVLPAATWLLPSFNSVPWESHIWVALTLASCNLDIKSLMLITISFSTMMTINYISKNDMSSRRWTMRPFYIRNDINLTAN
jgi:hypothetical protein